jgi:hypothetical protein
MNAKEPEKVRSKKTTHLEKANVTPRISEIRMFYHYKSYIFPKFSIFFFLAILIFLALHSEEDGVIF